MAAAESVARDDCSPDGGHHCFLGSLLLVALGQLENLTLAEYLLRVERSLHLMEGLPLVQATALGHFEIITHLATEFPNLQCHSE